MWKFKKKPTDKPTTRKPNLKTRLDKEFSLFIRQRDQLPGGVFRCISCGQIKPYEQADCGHYINRQHMSTRFDEMNCNAQCRSCNRYQEGNAQGYRQGLIQKYGERDVILLEAKKKDSRKYDDFQYNELIKHYKVLNNVLKSEKGV